MLTSVHDDTEFVCESMCHTEPLQVLEQDSGQTIVKLSCVTDNTCGSIRHVLQSVGDRLCGSSQYCIALVNTGGHERVDECGRFIPS